MGTGWRTVARRGNRIRPSVRRMVVDEPIMAVDPFVAYRFSINDGVRTVVAPAPYLMNVVQ